MRLLANYSFQHFFLLVIIMYKQLLLYVCWQAASGPIKTSFLFRNYL